MTYVKDAPDDARPGAWIEGDYLMWVDEDGKVHRVPTEDDIEERSLEVINNQESPPGKRVFRQAGFITAGDCGNITTVLVPQGDTLYVDRVTLMLNDGTPAPTGVNLVSARLTIGSGYSLSNTIVEGDGTVVYSDLDLPDQTAYINSSGEGRYVMFGVDNGHFGSGSGADQDVQVGVRCWTE